jgi:predicted tellurium resistance membrane protein TerC
MAMFMRAALLLVLAWIVGLTAPLFALFGHDISGRDLILIGGGLFLFWKSVKEIHQLLEGEEGAASAALMMAFAGAIGRFVSGHPTIKMLALAFLVVVGVVLIAAGFDHEVPKDYVYFAMAFAVGVELLNIRMRKRAARPVHLHVPYVREEEPG